MNSFIGISKLHTTNLAVVAPGSRSIAQYRALYAEHAQLHQRRSQRGQFAPLGEKFARPLRRSGGSPGYGQLQTA
jgi:hypothetical protein